MISNTLEKWEEKTLHEVLNKVKYTSKIQSKLYKDKGKYPIISQEDVFISGYWDDDNDVYHVTHPIVIFGDHTKVVKYIDFDFVLGADGVKILDPTKDINAKFLYYWTKYVPLRNLGYARHYKLLSEKTIRFPSLPEQERIVAKLDKAFEAIDKVKANAEKNLINAKELFESALDKAFTENTEGWEEKTLEKIGNIQTGTTPKTSEKDNFGNYIPFIKPADFNPDGTLNYNNEGLSEKGLKVARFIPKNSVLMVCIGATITKTGYSEIDTTCNQQINTLTPTKDSCKFIYYAMVRKEFKEKILAGCPQTTLPIINKSNWSALTIKLPKIDEQQKIVEKLDALQEQTKQLEAIYTQKIKECDELKQSILQKAFRGEL